MKHFTEREVREALAYAETGGQALHTHQIIVNWEKAPACFRREVQAGRDIAHLFDQDALRLQRTVAELGVKVIVIERYGQPGQHIDLCGGPLKKALTQCAPRETASLFGDDL